MTRSPSCVAAIAVAFPCVCFVLSASAVAAETAFIRSDCNASTPNDADTPCDISDAIFALHYLFVDGEEPPCLEACNANGDRTFDIADPIYGLSFCFAIGPPPPAPYPDCGIDPHPALSCREFPPCPQDPCAAQDAVGVGPCDAVLGVYWDGEQCREQSGCECEGVDCADGFETIEACEAAFADCKDPCAAQDARGVGDCEAIIGVFWDGRQCRADSGCECEGEDCDELFDSIDACLAVYGDCEPDCAAQDAVGVGPCDAIVGIFWDGSECRYQSGCECEGEDCDESFRTIEECEASYAICKDPCEAQDARGVGPCAAIVGVFWDGEKCGYQSGCSCEGADCDDGFNSIEECKAAFEDCDPKCAPQDAKSDEGPCDAVLGVYWDGDRCRELSGCECIGEDCADRFDSVEECYLAHGGCVNACDPMRVEPVGLCRMILGYYWTGQNCQFLSGCECAGEDCDELYVSAEECEFAQLGCPK